MENSMILVVLPSECAHLAAEVLRAGATPVIDLTANGSVEIPSGAWVRVRPGQKVPGEGPVVWAGEGPVVEGRPTWLERVDLRPVAEGYAGVLLRGKEAGGPCGDVPGLQMLAQQEGAAILDAGLSPETAAAAMQLGAAGVVVSDQLYGLPELGLGENLRSRALTATFESSRVVEGFRLTASPLSPVVRKLSAGGDPWALTEGWHAEDDALSRAWPAGQGLALAEGLLKQFGGLSNVLARYRDAVKPKPPQAQAMPSPVNVAPAPSDVAIVGLGCVLPDAHSVEAFWENVVSGRDCLSNVPTDRWDPARYMDSDRTAPDKSYTQLGGWVRGFTFRSKQFRIPPKVAKQLDVVQQWGLTAVAEALADAGMVEEGNVDRSRVAVILGNTMGGSDRREENTYRVWFPESAAALARSPGFAALPDGTRQEVLAEFEREFKRDLLEINEDTMPGELSNVISGRVANAFDFGGPNFTADAACASSMAAIQAAVKGLQDGDYDVAVTGGVDSSMGPPTFTKFCKIGALSPDHSSPFDASADGFVMGEGAAILILKRVADAERDGDRIYAVLRGIGASSDGKGKAITAPNIQGQLRALRRAYADAGIDPVEVDLMECHGTSTVVGDKVETEALSEVIGGGRRGDRGAVRIGSVKSQIGHLKSAAGAASTLKAALAIHHKILPPSINFKEARPEARLDLVPLKVQTQAEPWRTAGWERVAGVSAFGFGGTNFHMVLGEHCGAQRELSHPVVQSVTASPHATRCAVPPGIWAVSGQNATELLARMDQLERGQSPTFQPTDRMRLSAAYDNREEMLEQLQRARKPVRKGRGYDLIRVKGIHFEDTPCNGKLAFLFTGQGSQYIGMGLDLAQEFEVVRKTFEEASAVMEGELEHPLMDYIAGRVHSDEDASFEALRATEISQPATLTVDVAILRLLASYGVMPDVVAGHSLGEYGAVVAAGMMEFPDALRAVSARGREMASVDIPDVGKMAGIAASTRVVEEVLAEIPGYVVAANKNCPTQTVIAGATDAVEAASEAFRSRGITVYPLPVSHAFHSEIVAPASGPLKQVLERLDVKEPRRPITTNVTSEWYPTGEGAAKLAIENLAKQVAAPVEWTAQMERLYSDGARVFVECGPKRALTGFAVAILQDRPHRALYTNQPKFGGVRSFRDALAGLLTLGFPVREAPASGMPDIFATPEPRLRATSPAEAETELRAHPRVVSAVQRSLAERSGLPPEGIELDWDLQADLGIDTVRQAEIVAGLRDHFRLEREAGFLLSDHRTVRQICNYFASRLGEMEAAWDRSQPAVAMQPRPVRREEAPAAAAAPALGSAPNVPGLDLSQFASSVAQAGVQGLDAAGFAKALFPAIESLVQQSMQAFQSSYVPNVPEKVADPVARSPDSTTEDIQVVCTGASVGLPGGKRVFDDDNFRSILDGENRITVIPEEIQDRMIAKGMVRLVKDERGQGSFEPVLKREEVIKLAGRAGEFDLVEEYGVDAGWKKALDRATQLAFGAGIEALRDAGIPLVRTYKVTTTGAKVGTGWALPESMRETTGVLFASAFPGLDRFAERLTRNGHDEDGHFDRRFLFQVLSMGHSQFAQFIQAKGPNTQVNAACASTTQGIGIAEDWIRLGRCERVIVLGADDVTSDNLLEWMGAGFLTSGAATTTGNVEDAALPFDRRRHGMIMGMGAVGLVLERSDMAAERGIVPLAELLSSRFANSAFHGTRLDVEHIKRTFTDLIAEAARKDGTTPEVMATKSLFMSHETYTPARGGSAAAEISALRSAFGAGADEVIVTNTKGFTGHSMGAGLEDAVCLKALQYGRVPPIPNLKEPDPDLGNLRLSPGGEFPVEYAIRLAAGFGSQLSLLAWKGVAKGDHRILDIPRREAWLKEVTGYSQVDLVVEKRSLRALEGQVTDAASTVKALSGTPAPAAAPPVVAPAPAASPATSAVDIQSHLLGVIAEKTGYDLEDIELDMELEADLGIDTVKQAEIFGEVREKYGVAQDDDFVLADYPTIEALAAWMADRTGGPSQPTETPTGSTSEGEAVVGSPAEEAKVVPATEPTPVSQDPADLPPSFRLRRPCWVDRARVGVQPLTTSSVRVIGEGSLPAGLRSALAGRGISIASDADVVIDASQSVWDSWKAAQEMDAGARPSQWICVVAPEAGSTESAWAHGARAGFAKALGREWSDTRARVVQLHPSLPVELALESVLAELEAGNAVTEVMLSAGDHRRVLEISVEERPERGALPEGQVILVTGGGRGITARVALEFARRSPCTLVLVGRSQAGEAPLDEGAEKTRIKAAIQGEGKRVTPAEVDRRLKPYRAAEEIRKTMVDLQAAGAAVDYRTCDLANPDAVMGLVADTESTHGRIDGCIHGAGVEESRLVADKDDKAFHRVFDGKAVGGLALVKCLPTKSWFLSMGSVAGRFGNEGQVDYSAANEAMAQICVLRDKSLHMDWTAWADVGMAVRGGMKTLLEGRGVEMLPADAGAALCVDLVAAGLSGELVVSGGLGGLLPGSGHAWMDGADLDGDDWVVTRTVSVETDAWILDHAIGGVPVLPGVAGIELMAAAAELACPGLPYAGVENLAFQAPVKLYRGESIRLEIRARALGEGKVRCSLHSERTVKTGNLLRTDHFQGTICLGNARKVQTLPPAFFGERPLSAEEIYQRFFHGPSFQVLTGARDVSTDGLLADGALDHSALAPDLLTDPLVLEAAFQAAGLHSLVVDGVLALPAAIDALTVNRRFKPNTAIELTVRRRGDLYDVDVVQKAKTVMSLRGFAMIQKGPLPEGERFTPPSNGWAETSFGSATVAEGQPGLSPTEIAQLRARGTVKRQDERIAGRVAAKRALQALTGAAPRDIRIESCPSGAPLVRIAGEPGPALSISHSDGAAIAIARRDGRVGVDLETIEERSASFAREWFTKGEQERYGHDPVALTVAWAAKESVLKALGTGMALHPREVEVFDQSEARLQVVLHGRARAKHQELGGGDLALDLSISGERVLVTAHLAA